MVEDLQAANNDVDMTVGDRVERAGVDGQFRHTDEIPLKKHSEFELIDNFSSARLPRL